MLSKTSESNRVFRVGERIRVAMRTGDIVAAVIRATSACPDGLYLQIDFGKNQSAVVTPSQVVKED
jgi:hypothetical protein